MRRASSPDDFAVLESRLLLGNARFGRDDERLKEEGVFALVNLILFDAGEPPPKKPLSVAHFLHHPVADKPKTGLAWAEGAARFIDAHIVDGPVLVHCSQGVSRAPSLCIYYLMTRRRMSLRVAYDLVREKRPVIVPSIGFFSGLAALDLASSFPIREYALQSAHELFPAVARSEIERAYDECANRESDQNIDPQGFFCVDLLLERFPGEFRERKVRMSLHHPFD